MNGEFRDINSSTDRNHADEIDLSLLDYLQTLSVEERFERHEQALALVRALRAAGQEYYGYDPRHPYEQARISY